MRFQNTGIGNRRKTKMADVSYGKITDLESKNQFSARISTEHVTFAFILCLILEKDVTVVHNLYVINR